MFVSDLVSFLSFDCDPTHQLQRGGERRATINEELCGVSCDETTRRGAPTPSARISLLYKKRIELEQKFGNPQLANPDETNVR